MLPFSPAFKILVLLLAILSAFGSGVYVGTEWEEGRNAKLEVERLRAEAEAIRNSVERNRRVNGAIQKKLDKERSARVADGLKFERNLRDAKPQDLGRCNESPAKSDSADPVALTSAFVRLWNDALCQGVAEGDCAKRADDPSFGAGFVVPKDVLGNLKTNSESCAEDRARLRGWQRLARELGFAE